MCKGLHDLKCLNFNSEQLHLTLYYNPFPDAQKQNAIGCASCDICKNSTFLLNLRGKDWGDPFKYNFRLPLPDFMILLSLTALCSRPRW